MSLLLVTLDGLEIAGFIIDFRAVLKLSGGKNGGNENPAAAAACNDCNSAAECSWALRRSSATDVVRGSLDDVDTPALVIAGERFALNDAIDDVVADVIEGQHEHRPGNPEKNHNYFIKFGWICKNVNSPMIYWLQFDYNQSFCLIFKFKLGGDSGYWNRTHKERHSSRKFLDQILYYI